MVHIVSDWVEFSIHAEKVRRGFYREIREMNDDVTIRIVAGKLGFESTCNKDSEDLATYRDFLKFHGFLKVERSESADYFLR